MKRALRLLLVLSVLGGGMSQAQDVADRIDRFMTSWHEAGRFDGAVLVARDGEVIYKKGFGYADRQWMVPNAPDTKFQIGSISKQFTTVLVFQLAAEGRLSLEDKVTDHLPDYRRDTGSQVTIDHLLRHTSGIPCYLRDYEPEPGQSPMFPLRNYMTREYLVREHMSGDLLFEPGAEYRYSNTNYYLLALIIEAVTGKTYEENLAERILEPLGLGDTGLDSDFKVNPRRAAGYTRVATGYIKSRAWYPPNVLGAGSVYSTVEDLLKWNLALHSGGLLGEQWRAKMVTPYWDRGPFDRHAYSLDHFSVRIGGEQPVQFTAFNGAMSGFISDVFRFPATGHIIALLDNSEQFNHWQIIPGIYLILMGGEPREPLPQAGRLLAARAIEQGVDSAEQLLGDLQTNHSGEYDFGNLEGQLNSEGFMYSFRGFLSESIPVYKLNIRLHPGSEQAYSSLASVYERAGEAEPAAQYRQMAEEIGALEDTILELLRAGRFDEARQAVEQNLEAAPIFTPSRIGPLYDEVFNSGRSEDALQICRIWALGNPGSAGPLFSMARIYRQMGDNDGALECYRRVLQISSSGRSADTARRFIEELEGQAEQ